MDKQLLLAELREKKIKYAEIAAEASKRAADAQAAESGLEVYIADILKEIEAERAQQTHQPADSAPAKSGKRRYEPDANSNVGRAVAIVRKAFPHGLTMEEILQRSAENGQKPLILTSIGSQIRYQVNKFKTLRKDGDRYYAIM